MSGLWLVMKGSVARDYVPYCFALGLDQPETGTSAVTPDETRLIARRQFEDAYRLPLALGNLFVYRVYAASNDNKVSTKYNSYITYTSGNPDNVSVRYNEDSDKGEVGTSLVTYPTLNTQVGRTYDDAGNETIVYAKDLVQRYLISE